ncbi:MAG: ferredoxin family 2Fe-2S iron-sulfur cluster binding protein [Rhodothalassiaceae bacterium]
MSDEVRVTFVTADGRERRTVSAPVGMTLLALAHREGVDLEGACGGSLACSTCHVILASRDYRRLPPPGVEEEDMLALAEGLTATSRLACQIVLAPGLDGLEVRLPEQD